MSLPRIAGLGMPVDHLVITASRSGYHAMCDPEDGRCLCVSTHAQDLDGHMFERFGRTCGQGLRCPVRRAQWHSHHDHPTFGLVILDGRGKMRADLSTGQAGTGTGKLQYSTSEPGSCSLRSICVVFGFFFCFCSIYMYFFFLTILYCLWSCSSFNTLMASVLEISYHP